MVEFVPSLILSIASFLAGFFLGFLTKDIIQKNIVNESSQKALLIVVVVVVWALSVLYDIINPVYETSPLVHGIMGAIVGFFFWRPKG